VRDTGPYVEQTYYGVHPAVKIYYSPQVVSWLKDGRKGSIPDGAMIVKEQFPPPAGRYKLAAPPPVSDWTVMIKDAKGSADGWYWAETWDKQCADNNDPPFAVRNAGFGLYCVRCHASAEHELTFSALENIKGNPGEPLNYYDDNSWFYAPTPQPTPTPTPPPPCRETGGHTAFTSSVHHDPGARDEEEHKALALLTQPPVHAATPDPQFLAFYDSIRPVRAPQKLPGESFDHVFARPAAPGSKANLFLTSDSCMGCHSGITYSGNVMLYEGRQQPDGKTPAMNVSPFAEWRWSPMGLAGRDPVFYSQLDSEIAYLKTQPRADEQVKMLTNTCFKCHGVMGKRTLDADRGGTGKGDFQRDFVYITDERDPNFTGRWRATASVACPATASSRTSLRRSGTSLRRPSPATSRRATPTSFTARSKITRSSPTRCTTRSASSRSTTPTSRARGCAAVATPSTCRSWTTSSPHGTTTKPKGRAPSRTAASNS
jgi:hypothetical protein